MKVGIVNTSCEARGMQFSLNCTSTLFIYDIFILNIQENIEIPGTRDVSQQLGIGADLA